MSARRPYEPQQDGPLLSAYVDGELDREHRDLVERWLAGDPRVREEVDRLVSLRSFTDQLVLREAPAEAWEDFHAKVYNRGERSAGWILLLVGIAVVGGFALLRLALVLLAAAIPVVVRLGVLLAGAGLLVLLISVLRERLFTRKRDRYDDVVR
jgi:anti-sigma factor RsiW